MDAWPRHHYTAGGGTAHVALIALSSAKLPEPMPVSRRRHGMPSDGDGSSALAIVVRERAEDPQWFVDRVVAPFAELIAADLGPGAAATALAADYAYVIEGELADPHDLGHLQAAWALAKCVCEEGAAVVVDVYAARAHLGSEVATLAPDRGFDIMHEVTLFFDEQADGKVAAWSLGLIKFGRPDLVVLDIAPEAATDAALMLRDLASMLAEGERVEPGDQVTAGGTLLTAEPFVADDAPVVAVEREAIRLRVVGPPQ